MKPVRLTNRQSAALDAIRNHIRRVGVPPSRMELAKALGIRHQSGVDYLLSALQTKGWLRIAPGVERGLRLLREGAPLLDAHDVPAVAAGNPIVAEDYTEPPRLHDFDSFAARFESRPDWFVRVEGDSLDRLGYRSGDILAVRQDPEPGNGELVVARIGNEVVVKRFCRTESGTIELQPDSHNPEHEAIRIDANTVDFEVIGSVVGAIVGTRREST